MDINKYALFVDVAETGNFTKTGERMGYTQPGVSHILKSMEAELGFPLFIRTRHGISLTSNAEAILPIVRNMLSINEQLEQTISERTGNRASDHRFFCQHLQKLASYSHSCLSKRLSRHRDRTARRRHR